jgi:hypothetical protein
VSSELGSQPLSEAIGEDGVRLHRPRSGMQAEACSASELAEQIRTAGKALGFVRVGFTAVDPR